MGTDKSQNNRPCFNYTEFTDGCPTDSFPSHLSRPIIVPLAGKFRLIHPSLHRLFPSSLGSSHHMTTFVTDKFFGLVGKDQKDHSGYKIR